MCYWRWMAAGVRSPTRRAELPEPNNSSLLLPKSCWLKVEISEECRQEPTTSIYSLGESLLANLTTKAELCSRRVLGDLVEILCKLFSLFRIRNLIGK